MNPNALNRPGPAPMPWNQPIGGNQMGTGPSDQQQQQPVMNNIGPPQQQQPQQPMPQQGINFVNNGTINNSQMQQPQQMHNYSNSSHIPDVKQEQQQGAMNNDIKPNMMPGMQQQQAQQQPQQRNQQQQPPTPNSQQVGQFGQPKSESVKTEPADPPKPTIVQPDHPRPSPPDKSPEPKRRKPPLPAESSSSSSGSSVAKTEPGDIKPDPDVGTKLKVWSPSEMQEIFRPIWERLYNHSEAPPFQIPVDPIALQIPDYFDVIKNPMDLSTIKEKLDTGKYTDPWQFVTDMWLMFDNAWLYNRRNSRVYRMCSKLADEFKLVADPVMRRAGFCCAQKLNFTPLPLCCFGKPTCTINVGAIYYCYESNNQKQLGMAGTNDKTYYCEKCFLEAKGSSISTNEDSTGATGSNTAGGNSIAKDKFVKKKNDEKEQEQFINCKSCGRKNHEICVLHKKEIWKEFVCDKCLSAQKKKKKENRFVAAKLPECELSKHIEDRVNCHIRNHDKNNEAGHVFIRVVFIGDKSVETRSGIRNEGKSNNQPIAEKFKYKAKALFAFEQIDGVDVCFFGLHVQEYDDKCPAPNQRRVYIGYLDSVKFFKPAYLRTDVYHELLISKSS